MEGGIKDLTERIRRERESKLNGGVDGAVIDRASPDIQKEAAPPVIIHSSPEPIKVSPIEICEGQDLSELIQQITSLKVSGQTKMLIRFDDKHMAILNKLSATLKINVVQFVNFLLEDFFDKHPDFKTLIKNSLKNSLKEI
jgi:hypothetical protein